MLSSKCLIETDYLSIAVDDDVEFGVYYVSTVL